MKLEATITLAFQARTLTEAGEKLDAVLAAARDRDDVDVQGVELRTPTGGAPVTLPHVTAAAAAAPAPHRAAG